ncbi:2OG-Fe(II) oxygenase superfamily [Fusarium albosuccineum]|uniref:2OG-Fe(II) oxygenase superfamily n=1 Tax=Fusarium albosuccineum TaxID=1237068 RepID=A0A8H4LQT6_9HYPO|nr:2OG-Fe(II) oxygenase superfamily [Fusarium albosuccineum]
MPSAAPHGMTQLVLNSYEGVTHRLVSTKPARDCTMEEIPIIDLDGMYGDLNSRKEVASKLLHAAETIGFFYIKNHRIPEDTISRTVASSKGFFSLPSEKKQQASSQNSSYGYHGLRERQVNPASSRDRKESFSFHYKPEFDPLHKSHLSAVPSKVWDSLPKDDAIWEFQNAPGFQEALMSHWTSYLQLARNLIRVIALGLDLPEDYFDKFTTYPGSDFAVNFTQVTIFTLLWQDEHRGLQVLNNQDEWIYAPPVPGTLVVNIGDFLMRLTNDRLKSTVHRVIQHGKEDRFSIPFFFGFNFDEKLGVLPTCTDEHNPPKYQPSTCGELIAKRLT